jgi:hypothetical protein
MDHKQDYLMEYYPINSNNSLDIIKKAPSSSIQLKDDIKNFQKVIK